MANDLVSCLLLHVLITRMSVHTVEVNGRQELVHARQSNTKHVQLIKMRSKR